MSPAENPLPGRHLRLRDREWDRELIETIVKDLIAEKMPGTEGRSPEELKAVVARVHEETVERVLARELSADDAMRYEWQRVIEELTEGKGEE
jgi:hypothetical protein